MNNWRKKQKTNWISGVYDWNRPNWTAISQASRSWRKANTWTNSECARTSNGIRLYLEAFLDLDSERSNTFGPGRIPLSKIFEYAACYQFDTEQTEDLVYLIREMDKAHVAKLISKNKTASNIDKGKQNQKRRRI